MKCLRVVNVLLKELEDCPSSQGFWYGICDGDGEMFIDMLKDRPTQEACRQAIQILSQLENAVEDYVDWY